MGAGWSTEALATFVAAVVGAVVAAVSVATTMVESRATRRRVAAERHRDQWWERWSWIADRAFSEHAAEEQAAMLLLRGLEKVAWATEDDSLMRYELVTAIKNGEHRAG